MTAERRNLIIGAATLAALLLAFIVPNYRRGAASLSHPDPVGPTAYSKSAIGHLAFRQLLDEVGVPTSISESGSGGYVAGDSVLVVAEPRTDSATLDEVRAMLTARTVLLVLPKRTGTPDPRRPYWIAEDRLVSEPDALAVLHLADASATIVRGGSLAGLKTDSALSGAPSIENPQLIRSHALHALLASPDGILIGELPTRTGRIAVLSDPDLIANYNLTRGDNAPLAVSLVEYLRESHPDGIVIFDEFSHGFSEKPFHILGILFQFPFVLVTAQMGLATLLLIWAATGRFGTPVPLAPPLEAGKRSLIDNATRLLAQSGRIPDLSERYFEEIVRDTGRQLRAPGDLDLRALVAWISRNPGAPRAPEGPTAPEHIWKWRKELLGESRTHAQFD
jgi:hypothetical protein